ncbi:hypothetical protein [Streptomyces sp. NPDC002215]|uniref:hypothetical protein n=1 Tax=Streptomyces sp. NPDC002215 TaxID=3154412 RepID=UPI0033336F22
MVITDGEGRVMWCSQTEPGSCVDITHARQLELVKLLADGPAAEILANGGYQGLGHPDRRTRGHATAPQVQEGTPLTGTRRCASAVHGALLTPYPGRAWHRPSEELAG